MKVFLSFISLFIISKCSLAQHDEQLLKNLNIVFEATKKNDYKTTLDYTCPQIFTLASREDLLAALDQAFNSDEFKMVINHITLDTIYPAFIHDNQKHVVIKYNMGMLMKFTQTNDSAFWNFIVPMMQQQFGPKSTKALIDENALEINTASRMLAIKKDEQTDWCLFNYDSAKAMAEIILGEALVKKIETYK